LRRRPAALTRLAPTAILTFHRTIEEMIKPIDQLHLEETAATFKALSIPRLQTLTTLACGERNVGEIVWAEHDR